MGGWGRACVTCKHWGPTFETSTRIPAPARGNSRIIVAAGGNYLLNVVDRTASAGVQAPAAEWANGCGCGERSMRAERAAGLVGLHFSGGRITTKGNNAHHLILQLDADRCALAQPTAQRRRAPRSAARYWSGELAGA